MSEWSLLALALLVAVWTAAGGEQALRDLYRQCGGRVMAMAYRILRDRAEAEDVVQETFVELWRRREAYDERRASPAAWALVVARSRAIDRLRARSALMRAQEAQRQDPPPLPPAVEPVEEREERERVLRAIAELPPEQRQTVELAFYGGLSHTEIAARLDQPLGTVKTRVRLAMEKLQERLAPAAPATGSAP
jgi:RNA polymerase sigma-70 factor (ECF subfamily)